jgi:hypothetical protein
MGKYSSALLNEEDMSITPTVSPGKYSQSLLDPAMAETEGRLRERQAEEQKRAMGREQIISETPSISGRISEAITGRQRETEATRTLPEFRETEEVRSFAPRGVVPQLKLTAGLLSSFTPQSQMDVIKENIPEAEFMQDEKGNIVVDVNGQQSILNKPGFSKQDAVRALTGILSFVPAAKMSQLGSSAMAKIGFGGGSAAATEKATQEIAKWAGSKEPTDTGKIVTAGLLGGAAEAIGPAREAIRTRRLARGLGAEAEEIAPALENIAAAEAAETVTGIPLYKAQKTAIPSELERQSFVAQLPAGTQRSMKALSRQNEAAGQAVEDLLQTIAPPEAITTGAERFRKASKAAIDAQKTIRKERTSPLFKKAFENKTPIDTSNVDDLIISKLDDFPEGGEVSNSLYKVSKLIGGKPDLKKLQNAKLEIDQMISRFGEGSLGNTTKREIVDVKNTLLDTMDNMSPDYKAAREAFAAESPAVTALEESILGKIAALDDTSLKRVSQRIFDPAETNVKVISDAKKIINDVDPEAWNQLLRVELERRLGTIVSDVAEGGIGAVDNIPLTLRKAMFGNPKQKSILYKSVDGPIKKNLEYLETALRRAGLGRPGGSQTAAREEIKRELRGGVSSSIRKLFKNPVDTLAGIGDDAAFNKRTRALAEAMFNPDYIAPMTKIRKMDPNTAAAGKAITQLINDIDLSLNSENIINETK